MASAGTAFGAALPEGVFDPGACHAARKEEADTLIRHAGLLITAALVSDRLEKESRDELLELSRVIHDDQASRVDKCSAVARVWEIAGGARKDHGVRAALYGMEQYVRKLSELSRTPGASLVPPADRVVIDRAQRRAHLIGELLAVGAVFPFMMYLSTRRDLAAWARLGAATVGVGSLLFDGYVLLKFLRGESQTRRSA